jgi:hypothetical protein
MSEALLEFDDFLERVDFYVQELKNNNVKRVSKEEWGSADANDYSRVKIFQKAMGTNKQDIGFVRKDHKGNIVIKGSQIPFLFRTEHDAQKAAKEILDWIKGKDA